MAAASLVPVVVGRTQSPLFAEIPRTAMPREADVSMLRACFKYDNSTEPRLMATSAMLQHSDAFINRPDADAKRLFAELKAHLPSRATDLRKRYQAKEPDFSFGARSDLLDCVIGYGLLSRVAEATSEEADVVIGAAMDLVGALGRAGKKTIDLHVGQASNILPLAVAYDWLYAHMSAGQRKAITAALLDYSVRPTLEALYGFDPRAWWVKGMNNWTTICIGGAIASVLALRKEDDPGEFTIQTTADGKQLTRPYVDHAHDLLSRGLENLSRPWLQIASNNGLWGEGPGYQHDAILPLFSTVISVESAIAAPAKVPAVVRQFLADATIGAGQHMNSSLHLASPLGDDFAYSDGGWSLTDQPINLLIADYARRGDNAQWRAGAWQAIHRGGKSDLAMHLLFRAQFEWNHDTNSPRGMAGYDIESAPKAIYFFDHKAALPATNAPIPNPHVVIWRQSWTDAHSTAVMFKGGDNRMDYHSHLDVGTFTYDSQGVSWAIELGRAEGYIAYREDGLTTWKENSVVFFQPYPKRACGHNTLVMNSAVNDYTNRAVPEPWRWLWQINPDQALFTTDAWSPVNDIDAASSHDIWRASVDLSPVYQHHGAAEGSRRRFEFDRRSGALTITDELAFKKNGNDLWWFMHVAATTVPVYQDEHRIVLSAKQSDGTPVYTELALLHAPAGGEGLQFGAIERNLPAGQPGDPWLWCHKNAEKQKRGTRKLSMHFEGLGTAAKVVVRLRPMPELAGKTALQVRSLAMAAASSDNGFGQ